jgi:hypothetical protein
MSRGDRRAEIARLAGARVFPHQQSLSPRYRNPVGASWFLGTPCQTQLDHKQSISGIFTYRCRKSVRFSKSDLMLVLRFLESQTYVLKQLTNIRYVMHRLWLVGVAD